MTIDLKTTCAHCGAEHEHASGVADYEDETPEPGDCTICLTCGKMNIFNDELQLRKPNESEQLQLDNDARVLTMRLAWVEMKRTCPDA